LTGKNEKNCKEEIKETFIKKWGVVFVLSLALAIILIDATLLNVSLSTLVRELKTNIQSLQWVITAYSLTLAALTITGGRLGDLFGRKKMFVTGAILFAIGSFVASISHNVSTMIVGESLIEGVGAALMMPATASLLISKYKGRDRGIAFGIWGGVAGAATAIGPLLGGWLTTNYSWRWGFRINVVVAAILVLGSVLISECKDTDEKPKLDIMGVLLSSIGMLSIVYGIIEASTYGWVKAKVPFETFGKVWSLAGYSITPVAILFGVLLLILFAIWQRKIEEKGNTPLVSLSLFQNKQFVSGTLTTAVMSLGQAGLIFSIPIFLQSVRGATAFQTGQALVPLSIAALIIAPIGGALSHKIAPKRLIQVGLALNLIGYIVLRYTLNVDSVALDFALPLAVMGAGMGLTMGSISNLTLSAVSPSQSGEASGVNNTLRQVGGTLGTAIIGAVLITSISTNLSSGIASSNKIPERVKLAISENFAKQTSNVEFGGGAKLPEGTPKTLSDEITTISKIAVTDSNKKALDYAVIFALMGLVASFWLQGGVNIETEQIAIKNTKDS
jgi:EmrB/QacA subfamily drug resistance transporter